MVFYRYGYNFVTWSVRIALLIFSFAFVFAACDKPELGGFDQDVQYAMDFKVNAAGDTTYLLCMPSAFSPNADGLNDIYHVWGGGVDDFSMKIFTRENNLMFETDDFNEGFNGAMQGSGQYSPEQLITVNIDLTDTLGERHVYNYDVLMYR